MRFSSRFVRLSVILAVVLLFVAAGISSGSQIASLAQGSTPAATTQTFAPCPANSSSTGGTNATMSATDSAGGATGSGTGGTSATMSPTSSAGGTAGTAYIGIEVTDVENCGVQVLQVLPGSPADMAKLMVDDVIVAVNGQALSDMASGSSMGGSTSGSASATMSATSSAGGSTGSTSPSAAPGLTAALASFVQQHQPGDMLTLTIERAGQQMDVHVTLAANPSSTGGASSGGTVATPSATASQ